ncbi:aldehyde dehydrogenase family protein [Sandaracinobacteroides saxicola]|uniref:Aldehyde dehydrogenase family protein n=1 Tax=Sandaracinobacteroides saxicola TaxID=2759707 RepID=A0A7G5IGD2_9SPHN|nr:aldehyde dehydrogenase family protein [Sandaracinobacteroides saxicola]QMW22424.1 aldehyde dehydrogenase family protein [Sandaracinobacteroides saxicola]
MKVRNPHSGLHDHCIAPLDAAAIAAHAAALRAAQPAWAGRSPDDRAADLMVLADALEASPDLLAALTADTGRHSVARLEISATAAALRRWAATAPALIAAAHRPSSPAAMPGITFSTAPVPYALVGVISPWNFPLLLALTDAIPALAAGCAALVKPSEVTPRFIAPLMACVATIPALAPVLAVVEGDGATGAALVNTVDFIAFTGSVATGRKVAEAAARAFVPASLELGGKDPMIILASADPHQAAAIALSASCRATGQACQSIERIYVARAIAEPFLAELTRLADAVPLNTASPASAGLGPFIFEKQAHQVQAQVDDALAKGATLLAGGRVENHGGLWLRPTILTNATSAMAVMTEETFGPVMPVTSVDTPGDAIALANSGDFGLSAAVLAGTLDEAAAVARYLHAGAVSLNDGALTSLLSDAEKSSFKLSGMGPPRSGAAGLTRFFRTRAIYAQAGTALPLDAFL